MNIQDEIDRVLQRIKHHGKYNHKLLKQKAQQRLDWLLNKRDKNEEL